MLSREVGKRRSTTWTDIILISDTVRTPRPESTNALKQNQLSPISLLAEHTIFTYTYLCSSMKQWYTTNTRRFAVWLPSKPASRREQEFSQQEKEDDHFLHCYTFLPCGYMNQTLRGNFMPKPKRHYPTPALEKGLDILEL